MIHGVMEYQRRRSLTSELTASAVIVGMTVLLCYAHMLPFLGVIISIFSPLPLVLHGFRSSLKMNFLVFVTLIALFIGLGLHIGVVFTIIAGVPAMVVGNRIKNGNPAHSTILIAGMVSTILTGTVYFILTSVPFGTSNAKPLMEGMTAIVKTTEKQVLEFMEPIYQKAKSIELEGLEKRKASDLEIQATEKKFEKEFQRNTSLIKGTFQNMLLIFPSAGIISCLITVFLYYWLAQTIIPRVERGSIVPQLERFSHWNIPWHIVWILIFGLVSQRLNAYLGGKNIVLTYIGANSLAVASFLLMLRGLSLIQFFLEKVQSRPLMKGVCYMVCFLFMHFVISLGLLDLWFDYRKKYLNPDSEETNNDDDFE